MITIIGKNGINKNRIVNTTPHLLCMYSLLNMILHVLAFRVKCLLRSLSVTKYIINGVIKSMMQFRPENMYIQGSTMPASNKDIITAIFITQSVLSIQCGHFLKRNFVSSHLISVLVRNHTNLHQINSKYFIISTKVRNYSLNSKRL